MREFLFNVVVDVDSSTCSAARSVTALVSGLFDRLLLSREMVSFISVSAKAEKDETSTDGVLALMLILPFFDLRRVLFVLLLLLELELFGEMLDLLVVGEKNA